MATIPIIPIVCIAASWILSDNMYSLIPIAIPPRNKAEENNPTPRSISLDDL